ncbi:MAG: hypothetical protein WA461_02370 [Nitrososphaeraceae archaeon]
MVGASANVSAIYAITNSTSNVNMPLYRQIGELRVNPYFAPDESCMFDTYQLQCIPGEDQECPKGYGQNEDGTCFLIHKDGCPEGYHSAEDDETGQCYPDTEPCYPGQIRDPDYPGCSDVDGVCKNYNLTSCFVDGIPLEKYPTADCLTTSNMDNCVVIPGYGCPETFATMITYNETGSSTAKCVPKSFKVTTNDQKERESLDPLRCGLGYKLEISDSENIYRRGDDPVGTCNKID